MTPPRAQAIECFPAGDRRRSGTQRFLAPPWPTINADVSTTPSGANGPESRAAAFTAEIDPRLVPTSQTREHDSTLNDRAVEASSIARHGASPGARDGILGGVSGPARRKTVSADVGGVAVGNAYGSSVAPASDNGRLRQLEARTGRPPPEGVHVDYAPCAVTYLIGTAFVVWFVPDVGPRMMGAPSR